MDWGDVPTAASVVVALASLAVAFRASGRAKSAEAIAERSALAAERSAGAAEASAESANLGLVVSRETLDHQKAVRWMVEGTTRPYRKRLSNIGGSTALMVEVRGMAIGLLDMNTGDFLEAPVRAQEVPSGGEITFYTELPTDDEPTTTTLEVSWLVDGDATPKVARYPLDLLSQ